MGRSGRRWLVAGAFALLPVVGIVGLRASSGGITTFSGDPGTGGLTCNECHTGGSVPVVTLDGPTLVSPGQTATFSLKIAEGQRVAGGLDVSASDGTLSVSDPGTQLVNSEITHNAPRPVDSNREVIWNFNWTAPVTPGVYTLYGAGNSVNLMNGPGGDRASTDTLDVTVMAPAGTPGESSGPSLPPLLVTAKDPFTGEMDLSYGTACETASNNIYYGPLDMVSTWAYTGEVCDIGTSGAYAGFDPGPGSYFFLVVGTKGADEGSYGRSTIGGTPAERPDFPTAVCGQTQVRTTACD